MAASFENGAVETWSRLGDCSLLLNKSVTALNCFNNSLKFNQLHLPTLIGLIKSSIEVDASAGSLTNTASCLNFLNHHLSNQTTNPIFERPEFIVSLAELYYTLGQYETGINLLNGFLHSNSKNAMFFLMLGMSYLKINKRVDGQNALVNGLSLIKNDASLRRQFHVELGKTYYLEGELDKALDTLSAGLALPYNEKDYAQLYLYLILSYIKKRDLKAALHYASSANVVVSQNYQLALLKAYIYTEIDPQESVEILSSFVDDQGVKNNDDFLPWYLLGRNYSSLKFFRSAYDAYQISLRKSSNFPLTWLAIGKLYLDLKQLPDALAAYSQALRLQSEEISLGSAIAWDGLSCVYEKCENQLMDASDACMRSANCFKLINNLENYTILSNRSNYLKNLSNQQQLEVREPCPIPEELIIGMLEMSTQERVNYIQNQSHGFKSESTPTQQQILSTPSQAGPSPASTAQNHNASPRNIAHRSQPSMSQPQAPQPQGQPQQIAQGLPVVSNSAPGPNKPRLPSFSGSHPPSSMQSPVQRPIGQQLQYAPSQFALPPQQPAPPHIMYHSVPYAEHGIPGNGPNPQMNGGYPMLPIGVPLMGPPGQPPPPPPPPGYYGQYVPNTYVSYNRRR